MSDEVLRFLLQVALKEETAERALPADITEGQRNAILFGWYALIAYLTERLAEADEAKS